MKEVLSSKVSRIFNPTDIEITYGDMILAYLMYLTWTVNHCLEELGELEKFAQTLRNAMF